MKITRPMCAVCNKPVDSIIRISDVLGLRTEFRVYCHGKVEQEFIGDEAIEDGLEIEFGWAFTKAKLKEWNG
jgi:hypothetical protein